MGIARDRPKFLGYSLLTQERVKLRTLNLAGTFIDASKLKPFKNFGEKGAWAYPGTADIFWVPPIMSGIFEATDFKFSTLLQAARLRRYASRYSLRLWRQSTFAYCSQGVLQIFTAPVYRAHCAVIFAIAQLSCILLISAPRLGVYYFFVVDSVCLYVCMSVCHSAPSNRFFIFCFSVESSHFWPSSLHVALYKTLFFDFRFRPPKGPNAQNLLPKIWQKIAYNAACMAYSPEMFGPTRGFSGMADSVEPYKMWGRPLLPWQRNLT